MKVKLLTDLTSYNPKFTRDAVGESNMHEYQREGQPWRTYVNVRIEGDMLPVGVDGVECLDNDYIRMKALQKKIEEKELLRQLKEAGKGHSCRRSGRRKQGNIPENALGQFPGKTSIG